MTAPPFLRFDPAAQGVLVNAQRLANERSVPAIDTTALLLSLLATDEGHTREVFAAAGIDAPQLAAAAESCRGDRPWIVADEPVTTVRDAINAAMAAAEGRGAENATVDELAVALLTAGGGLTNEAVAELGLNPSELARQIQTTPPSVGED